MAAHIPTNTPLRTAFHQCRNPPFLAKIPARIAITSIVGMKNIIAGLNTALARRLEIMPVIIAGRIPHKAATTTVPSESRYSGIFSKATTCPIPRLTATPTVIREKTGGVMFVRRYSEIFIIKSIRNDTVICNLDICLLILYNSHISLLRNY